MTTPNNGEQAPLPLYTTVESDQDAAAASAAFTAMPLFGGPLAAVADVAHRVVQDLQNAGLEAGVVMGSDRALEPANWDGQTHQQLWDGVHNQNDPSSGSHQGAAWVQVGNALAELNGALNDVVGATSNGWRGAGGTAASAAVLGLAQWGGQSAQAAQYLGNRMSDQTDAASSAKNAMPEPSSVDPQATFTQVYTSSMHDKRQLYAANPGPDGTVTKPTDADALQAASSARAAVAAQAEQAEAQRQEAIQVMKTYEATSTGVDETMPVFAPPPDEVDGSNPNGSSYSGPAVGVHSAGYLVPTATAGTVSGSPAGVLAGSGSGPGAPTPAVVGGGTSPGTVGTAPGGAGYPLEGGRGVGALGGVGSAAGSAGTGGAGANALAGGAGRLGGIAGGPVAVGGASGSGDQARTNRAYGPGVRFNGQGGQGGTGLTGRAGTESPAGLAGGVAGSAGAGNGGGSGSRRSDSTDSAAGRAGATGTGGAGARGKGEKGEEDTEHETPDYLKTIDLFGTTQVVAPAVIGEE